MQKIWVSFIMIVSMVCVASQWDIDPAHSSAHFTIRHMTISNVGGEITGMKGQVEMDDKSPSHLTLAVTLDPNTINTDNPKRDEDLRSSHFFDVSKFSTIQFRSTKVSSAGHGKYRIRGELTMHGVTKPISLNDVEISPAVKDPWGNERRGITASLKLNRKDYGMNWNKALDNGGVLVGDDVTVTISAEAVAKANKS